LATRRLGLVALPLSSLSLALVVACADSPLVTDVDEPTQPRADGGRKDTSDSPTDAGSTQQDGANKDAEVSLPACPAPSTLGRGLAWVRSNPMMISGLSVVMGAPSATAVNEYFDGFHATAAHVWENGLPTEVAGFAAANNPRFRYISWLHKDGKSISNNQVLGGAAALPGRIGYQIGDEPQDQASLNEIIAGAALVKAADPDGLRIINLNNSDAAKALRVSAISAADFDVLSYDHYTWQTSAMNGLMATREAAKSVGKPYWRYQASFHYKSDSPSATAEDMRWDALAGAVFGFTGNTWFLYSVEANNPDLSPLLFTVGGDYAATKKPLYQAAASINLELANIGRSLVLLESTDVRYVASIALLRPSSVAAWQKGAGNDPYLSKVSLGGAHDLLVGHFKDDCGEPYVMVQNQAHPGGTIPNNSVIGAKFTLEFDFAGATDTALDKTAVLALDSITGNVAPRVLWPTGATTGKLDLDLAPGAVFFFKYKNARPFVKQ
jgi:hypothetical protein